MSDQKIIDVSYDIPSDSYVIENFLDRDSADKLLKDIDENVTYLSRDDPRMLFKMYGKQFQLPRDKAFYGDVQYKDSDLSVNERIRVEPFYKYAKDTPMVEGWAGTVLEDIARLISKDAGQECNHVVVNQYRNGNDHIGFHHDKSKTFKKKSNVLTLSLGSSRILRLKKVKGASDSGSKSKSDVIDIPLSHGSLFVLGPKTNELYKHSIIKRKSVVGRRVSLTYRAIEAIRQTLMPKLPIM